MKKSVLQARYYDLQRDFSAERDRRYTEVSEQRDKALKIKETADETALGLDRELRAYKDEKANNLREQIGGERNLYATKTELSASVEKIEATVKPLADWVATQAGRSGGFNQGWLYLIGGGTLVYAVINIVKTVTGH